MPFEEVDRDRVLGYRKSGRNFYRFLFTTAPESPVCKGKDERSEFLESKYQIKPYLLGVVVYYYRRLKIQHPNKERMSDCADYKVRLQR